MTLPPPLHPFPAATIQGGITSCLSGHKNSFILVCEPSSWTQLKFRVIVFLLCLKHFSSFSKSMKCSASLQAWDKVPDDSDLMPYACSLAPCPPHAMPQVHRGSFPFHAGGKLSLSPHFNSKVICSGTCLSGCSQQPLLHDKQTDHFLGEHPLSLST